MAHDRVLGIFKFSQRQYIEQFVRGQLYMNTLAYFVNVENSPVRRDKREGQNFWGSPGAPLKVATPV
jgi:hypothetical protein